MVCQTYPVFQHKLFADIDRSSPSTSASPPSAGSPNRAPISRSEALEKANQLHKERAVVSDEYRAAHGERKQRLYAQMMSIVAVIDEMMRSSHTDMLNIDLHCMSVAGALSFVEEAVAMAESMEGDPTEMSIITGRGNNSKNNVPRIKPAVIAWLTTEGYEYRIPKGNDGIILITV